MAGNEWYRQELLREQERQEQQPSILGIAVCVGIVVICVLGLAFSLIK